MRKGMSEVARETNAKQVVSVVYPMAHYGAIWEGEVDVWLWEIVHMEDNRNFPIASGYSNTLSEAQDAMNGVMSIWVAYGNTYIADKVTQPPAPPSPLGFRRSNSHD